MRRHPSGSDRWGPARWRHAWTLAAIVLYALLPQPVVASAGELKPNCPVANETRVECMSLSVTGVTPSIAATLPGTGENGGFSPKDLHEAYNLPTTGGSGQTVAIVDAYNDPDAESNLATYREKYGLSACTEANGCFKKVNQKGEVGNYPEGEPGWSVEISLDLDMVSAVCHECHIVLVEANSASYSNMDAAENEAAALTGTTEISDSWGSPETTNRKSEESYFDHPGIPITVAAGDYCYDNECKGYTDAPNWPSTVPDVISVGGTKLEKASSSRGWKDSVWYEPERRIGTGSGCSIYEAKPPWETDKTCSSRTDTDVSAVAACLSPLSIYDSYDEEGWFNECGTSAATPIIAGVEALSTKKSREEGAEAFWTLGPEDKLNDVTEGSNWYSGNCGFYLCNAETGYDGPSGWGTPDGAFKVRSWAVEATPLASGATASSMTSVSCLSATNCMVVADYATESHSHAVYAERWNGTEWAIEGLPGPTGATASWMEGVSCASAASCVAVGYYRNSSGITVPLVEKWNGTEWTVGSAPAPTGATESVFSGVSCTSAIACTAVGQYVDSEGTKVSLAERWNGTTWSVEFTPNPSGAKETVFHGVSCITATSCIGAADNVTSSGTLSAFVERWNGSEWSTQGVTTPYGAQEAVFEGISCTSEGDCTAVGYYKNISNTIVTFVERWNGSEWLVQSTPLESGAAESALRDVSCASSTACTAVATYGGSVWPIATYSLRWNGSEWHLQGFPTPEGFKGGWTRGVSCSATNTCTAVGGYYNMVGTEVTLAEAEVE